MSWFSHDSRSVSVSSGYRCHRKKGIKTTTKLQNATEAFDFQWFVFKSTVWPRRRMKYSEKVWCGEKRVDTSDPAGRRSSSMAARSLSPRWRAARERPRRAEQDLHLLDLDQFVPSLEPDWCIDPSSPHNPSLLVAPQPPPAPVSYP